MNLILEVEYLSGVSFAAVGPDTADPEWPPQPDRIFSALVASWAARGQSRREADALEWLEGLAPPRIIASPAAARTSAVAYVPSNDARSDRQKHAREVLPAVRGRQPRLFPATRPEQAVVRFWWNDTNPDGDLLATLDAVARDTSYVGHSASLTRCRFLLESVPPARPSAQPARRVYHGRLAELRRVFDSGRRPLAGAPSTPSPFAEPAQYPATVFGGNWLVFEHVGGVIADLRASAVVAKTFRDALLSGYRRIGFAHAIPEELSGHASDGSATAAPHLAVVPLPFVGHPQADGHVLGFALIPPRGSRLFEDKTFRMALHQIAPLDTGLGRHCLTLRPKPGSASDRAFSIVLSPTRETSRRTLDPRLYAATATTFATITPIILDRHLKTKTRSEEIAELITSACRNVGLPAPVAVVSDKHSAFAGAPSSYPSGNAPGWVGWQLPRSAAGRPLTHAVISFASPVTGPILLGAGRFIGLGLCRPLNQGAR